LHYGKSLRAGLGDTLDMTSMTYSKLSHPLRVPLAAEIHSRPFMRLAAPETLTHFAVYLPQCDTEQIDNAAGQHAILLELCTHFGVTGPSVGAKHFFHDFGRFRLKWEGHTEFATYMFSQTQGRQVAVQDVFDHVPLANIPQQWLLSLQGKVMGASHVALVTRDIESEDIESELHSLFEGAMVVGSNLLQRAEIYTDFLIQSDGFSRFLVRDVGLRDLQAGRLVQRLLEIDTYRMMALLSLPHAQRATPTLNIIEDELAKLAVAMVNADEAADHDSDDEQDMLRSITALAARIERLSLDNTYRFSASQAYYRLVLARIEELRETRMEGKSTIQEFIDRRLGPAMNTFTSVAQRQEALAKRIANTNDLLRTRVGIVQEKHNRNILQSMNRRAALQLRLQQAVEGLSVVAISYYAAGLIGYVAKAAKSMGWRVNPDIATGALLPVVLFGVWLGLRRLHKGTSRHEAGKSIK
jgi:uncharacterized membrane-anchored protein